MMGRKVSGGAAQEPRGTVAAIPGLGWLSTPAGADLPPVSPAPRHLSNGSGSHIVPAAQPETHRFCLSAPQRLPRNPRYWVAAQKTLFCQKASYIQLDGGNVNLFGIKHQ